MNLSKLIEKLLRTPHFTDTRDGRFLFGDYEVKAFGGKGGGVWLDIEDITVYRHDGGGPDHTIVLRVKEKVKT